MDAFGELSTSGDLLAVVMGDGTSKYPSTKLYAGQDETGRDIHVASGARPRRVLHLSLAASSGGFLPV